MFSLFQVAYMSAIFFVVVGAILGLVGVWLPDFWHNRIGSRLLATDAILLGTALVVAIITKFLGS